MQRDLTNGSVFKNIVLFSLPFLFSYFLQTLYGMADLFIIGQFNSAESITAVSIGSQIMHMLTVIIAGLSMGSTVLIGQAVGSGKKNELSEITGTSITLFAILSIILTVSLFLLTPSIVNLVSTPVESIAEEISYLRICFIGLPFIIFYNVISSIFRGMGDSKTPLIFVLIACILNIALDFLFIGKFKMGASGASLATVISQTVSVIISLAALLCSKENIKLKKTDFKLSTYILSALLKIGLPIAFQDGFIQISFMVITIIANRRGISVAAAVGIVEKIITFLFLVPSSMLSSVSAIASQNIGAKKEDRAKKTLFYGTFIACTMGLIFTIIFQFAAKKTLSLFTDDLTVIHLGTEYLKAYVFDCIVAGVHFSFSGYFCANEKSILSFIHNALSIILFRIPGAYLASIYFPNTLYPMGIATVLGSLFSAIFCIIAYAIIEKSTYQRKSLQK